VLVSARTGDGVDKLQAAIEDALPERDRAVSVVVPYSRGDLVARAHAEGEVLHCEHLAEGTMLQARVPPGLAAEFVPFAAASATGDDFAHAK
jgi:GTP-binding protein HflX